MTNYVDWKFATSAGTRLVPPGPDVSPEEAVEAAMPFWQAAQTEIARRISPSTIAMLTRQIQQA